VAADAAAGAAAARAAVLTLLGTRAADGTICPSEAARALAASAGDGADWRRHMPAVHAAVDALVAGGAIRLRWKGEAMATRAGPYRIARGSVSS
jgi:hypothetical protein